MVSITVRALIYLCNNYRLLATMPIIHFHDVKLVWQQAFEFDKSALLFYYCALFLYYCATDD